MYDSEEFAEAYVKEKETHPFRTEMERYSLLSWLGSVKGKRVLDLENEPVFPGVSATRN